TLGVVGIVGNEASLPVSDLPAGDNSITAAYSGDTFFGAGTSAASVAHVLRRATSVTLAADPSQAFAGDDVTFTATVSDSDPARGPGGNVTFVNTTTGTALGVVGVVGNAVTLTVPDLPAGTSAVTATYSGDAYFTTGASAAANVAVNLTSVTATIAANPNQ